AETGEKSPAFHARIAPRPAALTSTELAARPFQAFIRRREISIPSSKPTRSGLGAAPATKFLAGKPARNFCSGWRAPLCPLLGTKAGAKTEAPYSDATNGSNCRAKGESFAHRSDQGVQSQG